MRIGTHGQARAAFDSPVHQGQQDIRANTEGGQQPAVAGRGWSEAMPDWAEQIELLAGLPRRTLRLQSREAVRVEGDGEEYMSERVVTIPVAGQQDLPRGRHGGRGRKQADRPLAGRAKHQRSHTRQRPPHEAMLARGEGPGNVSLVSEAAGRGW